MLVPRRDERRGGLKLAEPAGGEQPVQVPRRDERRGGLKPGDGANPLRLQQLFPGVMSAGAD